MIHYGEKIDKDGDKFFNTTSSLTLYDWDLFESQLS